MLLAISAWLGAAPFFLAGSGILLIGFYQWKKYQKIADISTSKVRAIAVGLVELSGKVVPIKLVSSPLSKTKCVYFKALHQIYQQDKSGKYWATVSVKESSSNFYLEDETGKVEVDPTSAEVDIIIDGAAKTEATGSKYISKSYTYPLKSIVVVNYRDVEFRLDPGDSIYLMGTAKIRPGVKSAKNEDNLIITKGENDSFYYISDKDENNAKTKLSGNAKALILVGAALIIISVTFFVISAIF